MKPRVTHHLNGYRRATDELAAQHAVPPSVLALARQLAAVGSDDPGAALSYALDADAARRICSALGIELDRALDYFLEPVGEIPAPAGRRRAAATV